jgi:hypothetical protein
MLKDWTDVKLYQSTPPPDDGLLLVPGDLFGSVGELPPKLVLRIDKSRPRRPLVVSAKWQPAAPGLNVIFASTDLLRKLGVSATEVYPDAQVKGATRRERARYDRGTQGWLAATAASVGGEIAGIIAVATGTGYGWIAIVVAGCGLVATVINVATGAKSEAPPA